MNHPLRCMCGTLRGHVSHPEKCTRLVCYCKDCQAFAHFLGTPGDTLDANGGTDILAVHPQAVTFTDGRQTLACMSLSESGMLRWYASCCNTPIGNTGRDIKMAHVGLVSACLENGAGSIDSAFGPVRMRAMTGSAKGPVASSALASAATIVRIISAIIGRRISGSYKHTPFFNVEQGTPVVAPKVLTPEERGRLMLKVSAS